MGTFITAIILIIAFLLGAVILVQNPKGGGLAAGFTGGASMGGVQRTTDFLEKKHLVFGRSSFRGLHWCRYL